MLTPEKVLEKVLVGNITKSSGNELLISFINSNQNSAFRTKCIELLGEITIKNHQIFNFFEYILISDESPTVRCSAAKILFGIFPKESITPFKWIIQEESSPLVLKTLYNLLESSKNQVTKRLFPILYERLSEIYDTVIDEALFLLDLDEMKSSFCNGSLYKPFIKDKHIRTLKLAGWNLKKLPRSIGNLSKLKHLNLWGNNLTALPDSVGDLTNLESLYLDYNDFTNLPEFWDKLKSLKKLSLTNNYCLKKIPHSLFYLAKQNFAEKYIEEGVIAEEAPVLGLLEILIGVKLKKLADKDIMSISCASNYIKDNYGHIIGVYIYGYYMFQITIFPEEICSLRYLKELVIRDQNITWLPESIKNLKSLTHLDLRRNKLEKFPDVLNEMTSLKVLELDYNKIDLVPEHHKKNNIDIWI